MDTETIHPLRRWRKEHRVTLTDLADRVGVSASHISDIENGLNTPSLELADALSRATEADGAPVVGIQEIADAAPKKRASA